MTTTIIGIDPGLVHTGLVVMQFSDKNVLSIAPKVFDGKDAKAPAEFAEQWGRGAHVFIESYRPRGNVYGTDEAMRSLLAEFKAAMPSAKILDNTGVKKVINTELMRTFDVWSFEEKTHHQDLRSAARIALYGAVKDDELNAVLYRYAVSQLMPSMVP